jgi:hypothetical protein
MNDQGLVVIVIPSLAPEIPGIGQVGSAACCSNRYGNITKDIQNFSIGAGFHNDCIAISQGGVF